MNATNTPSTTVETNRRACRRVAVERPCKVKDTATGRYIAGVTIDLSQHGMLVRLLQPSNLKPGDDVNIGVAMHEHQGLIQAKELIEARVVRRLDGEDGTITLAVQFHAAMQRQQLADTRRLAA